MVTVKKQKGESEDKLIARFRRLVSFSGILQEYRDRSRFVSDSEKRKIQNKAKKFRIKQEKKRNS